MQALWVSNTGHVACPEHGGMYLRTAIERRPKARRHATPLDAWELVPVAELDGLRCEGCPAEEPKQPRHWYVLQEYELSMRPDGRSAQWLEFSTLSDGDGSLLVTEDLENARGMARFMLGADHDGPEREPRENLLPFIAITEFDYPVDEREPDGYEGGWACGWVTLDGVYHDGDYENDDELWTAMEAFAAEWARRQ